MEEKEIELNAIEFAKKKRREIAKKFTDINTYHPDSNPVSVFMAGSPGAGKTEFSKNIISIIKEDKRSNGDPHDVIRIDSDEIRILLPGYTGNNSYLFQGATSIIAEKIHDFALKQSQSFVFDGTFSKIDKAIKNIERSLSKNRTPFIFYIYQNPVIAWNFTQRRERAEGRKIPKEAFIEQFFGARNTINVLREKFGLKVIIFLVRKNFENKVVEKIIQITPEGPSVDEYIKESYTKEELQNLL